MLVLAWMIGMATLVQVPPSATTAADVVTLKDGKIVMGQVLESERRGPLLILVRRDWAKTHLADRAEAWIKADAPITHRSTLQRKDRLILWRSDRAANPVDKDQITPWIDRELGRMADPLQAESSVLMVARISRNDVKTTVKRPRASSRLLRLGWQMGLENVEAMPLEDLKQAVEGRGYSPIADDMVSVDALLPAQPETDARWLARRAATELANDPGGRFVRFQDLLLPEPSPGEAIDAGAGLNAAVASIKNLLGEAPIDPLPAKLREIGAKGRVGAVVTRLNMAADFSSVAVETTLWVRTGADRWVPALVKSASADPGALPANAGAPLAEDPQIKAVFGLVSSLGLGDVPPELKQRSLNMGAATQRALGEARSALSHDLEPLVFSLESPKLPSTGAGPRSKPEE